MKYIEIIIECLATYFYLLILLRFLGKKEMGKLSILDLIVFLIISELMTMSIGDDKITFFEACVATLAIVGIDKLCSIISLHSKTIKKLLEGTPTYVIYRGKVDQKKMKALSYSIEDLCHHLREQGVGSISDVEFAILEVDGHLSVIERQNSHYMIPSALISDGQINHDILQVMKKDEDWLLSQLKKEGIKH
ncbi:MAG: DUF421 domain-containing protein, partial [Coprobacillus sp.]